MESEILNRVLMLNQDLGEEGLPMFFDDIDMRNLITSLPRGCQTQVVDAFVEVLRQSRESAKHIALSKAADCPKMKKWIEKLTESWKTSLKMLSRTAFFAEISHLLGLGDRTAKRTYGLDRLQLGLRLDQTIQKDLPRLHRRGLEGVDGGGRCRQCLDLRSRHIPRRHLHLGLYHLRRRRRLHGVLSLGLRQPSLRVVHSFLSTRNLFEGRRGSGRRSACRRTTRPTTSRRWRLQCVRGRCRRGCRWSGC